jgi:hypothetical protein
MPKSLSYDEQKAAEAAFHGQPCNPKWSSSARAIYDGIMKAMSAGSSDAEGDSVQEAVLSEG